MKLDWIVLKSLITTASLPYKYINLDGNYHVFAVDAPFNYQATIAQDGGSDQLDFETNFKSTAFVTTSQFDSDGAQIVRNKAAKKGWTYSATPFEFTTSDINSLYSTSFDGINRSWITMKNYDVDGVQITDSINNSLAVKTIIDFMPTFDYEVIGGTLRITSSLGNNDLRLWIVAVPDFTKQQGGSKEMAGGLNLKFLSPGNQYQVDGRVSKQLNYNSGIGTNKLRFILEYSIGLSESIAIDVELFKQ